MATQNGSGRGRDLPRTSKHLQFRNELPFPYRSAALAWPVEPFLKCGLPDRKEAGLSAPRIASFSVWGTVGCSFFLFCPELDCRYVFASGVIGSVSAQACLTRMLKEIQRDGEWFGVQEGPKWTQECKKV